MFDQNWLKRYMLATQQGEAGGEPPSKQDLGSPAFGGGTSLDRTSGLSNLEPTRLPASAGRGRITAGMEEPPPIVEGPSESARLGERTGLSSRASNSGRPEVPRIGAGLGPTPGLEGLPRGGRSSGAGLTLPPTMPSGVVGDRATTMAHTMPGASDAHLPPARSSLSVASSARHGAAANPANTVGAAHAVSGGSQLHAQYPHLGNHQTTTPAGMQGFPQASPGGAFFGAPPGPFGHAPFDNSASMHGGLFGFNGVPGESMLKNFVVMCKDDVEVRASPSYADDTRVGHFLHPGQVFQVDDRRMVMGSWFLHLADGRGWVFETKDRLLVCTEAKDFDRGLWHYSVVCEDDVETRISPTYSDDMRTGMILGSGDCAAVDERCTVAGARFLKLADGRGWVFETKDRLIVMSEVRAKAQEARDFARGLWHYTVVCDDDVEIRAAPTYSDEARTGLTIHPGDCVAVDERCRVAAIWFLRLADGRGWVFESKDSRRVMMMLH